MSVNLIGLGSGCSLLAKSGDAGLLVNCCRAANASFLKLIKESSVADPKHFGRSFSVPAGRMKGLLDYLPLNLTDRLTRDLLERHPHIGGKRELKYVTRAVHQIGQRRLF